MEHLRALVVAWSADRCSRKAAALAYYAIFSLAPLVVILVAIASWFIPDAREGLTDDFQLMLGERGASLVQQILKSTSAQQQAGPATLIATGVLLLGATSAFAELKATLDDIWGTGTPIQAAWWRMLRPRLKSFALVLALGVLVLASLVLDAALGMFSTWIGARLGEASLMAMQLVSLAGSYLVIAVLFAIIYKVLPDIRLSWRDVALSAVLTASLFMVGRLLMARFLGLSAAASVYGTASSLAVVLLWIYYSAMIFLLGVEIIKVWRRPAVVHRRDRPPAAAGAGTPTQATTTPGPCQFSLRAQTG